MPGGRADLHTGGLKEAGGLPSRGRGSCPAAELNEDAGEHGTSSAIQKGSVCLGKGALGRWTTYWEDKHLFIKILPEASSGVCLRPQLLLHGEKATDPRSLP